MSEQPFVGSDEVEAHIAQRRTEAPADGEQTSGEGDGEGRPFAYQ